MTQVSDIEVAPPAKTRLADRYRTDSGPVLMTGVQALVRQLVEQHERDRRQGNRTATFVSGYQGSPLAGFDRLLASSTEVTGHHEIRLVPGMNEELAATSVWGSQIELPAGARSHDGIVGVWYGKGPGLDRASDALRHGAMYGAHPRGGVLVLVGDDPGAKSSSVPCASERSLSALSMPILYPRNAEEIVAFGLYGVALSRASGCWVSMKLVADVADGLWTLQRNFSELPITIPTLEWAGRPWSYRQRVLASPPDSLLAEADLYGPRWAMVEAFAAANDIDSFEVDPETAWLGIVAVGSAYDSVREALHLLGLDEYDLLDNGIRILRVGMPYPLCGAKVRELARGVEQILVVEDKSSFVEGQVKEALFDVTDRPRVSGKRDSQGNRLIPPDGELTAARLEDPLRAVLADRVSLVSRLRQSIALTALSTKRTAYFCSGCPHNRSTAVPEGSLAAGGIGCHTLVTMSERTDSQVTGLTQMGGEGAQWIGQAPFTDVDHIFQNVGDGTYFHSGQLAVQACVAAGVNITYKILYNDVVAMTGAQDAEAGLGVPALTHKLAAEGVAKIIVCADEPRRHRHANFAAGVQVWDRSRLDEAQRDLRATTGVTVLIYDQHCAADARRQRKRGTMPSCPTRVFINEAVCEGCGDCGIKSNCLSVQPVDTDFGRKTQIDQTTCNTDYSCLDGECPSFVTIDEPAAGRASRTLWATPPISPSPVLPEISRSHDIFLAGIGGTGIVTVNQILAMAALRSGLHVEGLDQTGLSQKAGPVTSHLRISSRALDSTNRVTPGTADAVLAFDLLTAADARYASVADPARTVTIASTSKTPTGEMVYDAAVAYPAEETLLGRLDKHCRLMVTLDALAAAQTLFGSTDTANLLVVGAALQAGALPMPAESIEEAIEINGVAVEANKAAFHWGRAAVSHPDDYARATATDHARSLSDVVVPRHVLDGITVDGDTGELLRRRAAQLTAYQSPRYARAYADAIQNVWDAERVLGSRTDFSAAAARGLHKLLAYKDEYEVARMLTDPVFIDSVRAAVPDGGNLTYRLHPPLLKALGRRRKIGFTPQTHVVLRVLARAKVLRGTRLDVFGYTQMRTLERALAEHYSRVLVDLADNLTDQSYDHAVSVADAADLVRGYEDVKLRNVRIYLERLGILGVNTQGLKELM